MKTKLKILAIAFLVFGCDEEVELLGNIEVAVEKVYSLDGILYEDLKIGVFPTESLVTGDFGQTDAIVFSEIENETVRFDALVPGTYVVGVVKSYMPYTKRTIQVKPGQTTYIDLIED